MFYAHPTCIVWFGCHLVYGIATYKLNSSPEVLQEVASLLCVLVWLGSGATTNVGVVVMGCYIPDCSL